MKQEVENCAFCFGRHAPANCKKVSDVNARKNILVKYGRCFKCLQRGHRARDCKSIELCNKCGKSHHISICDKQIKPAVSEFEVRPEANPTTTSPSSFHVGAGDRVALQTARAVITGEGQPQSVRVLFDAGSHCSFVTARVAQLARLPVTRQDWLAISTFGQRSRNTKLRDVVQVKVSPIGGESFINMEAYVVPEISSIPNTHVELVKSDYPHLKGLWFSDVSKGRDEMIIDVLVGADYLKGCTIRGKFDEPVAVETKLGWVLSGPLKGQDTCADVHFTQVNFVASSVGEQESLEDVQRLWDLGTLGIREITDQVHESFENNISFNGSRYSVCLPWKEGHPELPTNYGTSLYRLRTQMQRLEKDPDILKEYGNIIEEQLRVGVIEKVAELEKAPRIHYLPHQAVVRKESATTKVRVVYDASSKESKSVACLNDCLHVGPPLTPLLYNILLRFRENRVVLVGDIEKAFLNVEVGPEDRDCLCFLWVEKPPDLSQVVVYRFCRVVFGLNASPFLLNATLRHHVKRYEISDSRFVAKLLDSFYVDDFVGGGATTQESIELYQKTQSRMVEGGFKLRKCLTNDPQVRAKMATETQTGDKQDVVTEEDISYAKSSVGMKLGSKGQKVLGCEWDYEADVIAVDLMSVVQRAEGLPATKRNTLRLLAGVYDPLGLISPITVSVKVIFQEICRQKCGWDEQLEGGFKKGVEGWIKDLIDCHKIEVKRCIYDHPREEVEECSLHGFADASKKAYCGVVYLVYRTQEGRCARMLCSKTRVAPLKELSIPRLELMAAFILVKLMVNVEGALVSQQGVKRSKLWLDSQTALFWIMNRGEWKQFVKHRVNEILKVSDKGDWRYFPSQENPADIGSRGMPASELNQNVLWWQGPAWLTESEESWLSEGSVTPTTDSREEERTTNILVTQTDLVVGIDKVIEIDKYSCIRIVLRVTAWLKRFCFNVSKKTKSERKHGPLSLQELTEAEIDWIKAAQRELKCQENYKQLSNKFGLIEDHKGVIRCRGRLEYADLPVEAKEPVMLPKDHHLTFLQILRCHKKVHHCGVKSTLAELRTKFWVPKGRQVVKKILSQCVTCKKWEGTAFTQPVTASLLEFRVNLAPPFSRVGVDFAGPMYVKGRGKQLKKVYVCLFSCCVTRALHLDLVEDVSTPTFLRCLRKFTARRGTPALIVSDNAKTFKGAEKEMRTLFRHPEVRAELDNQGIEWRFNIARAPLWGGFFEMMVKSVKQCLKKFIGNARLSFDEMLTVLVEVEGTLNSRPLTYNDDNPSEEVLTPSHLIHGRRIHSLPEVLESEEEFGENSATYSRRHEYLTKKLQHFWKRWQREYLTALRESHENKTAGKGRSPKEGDVVKME